MNNPINNEVFDTRDLIEYREHLESELLSSWNDWQRDNLNDEYEVDDIDDALTLISNLSDNGSEEFIINYSQEVEDYNNIIEFCDELEACAPDYQYGESVIHEDYFTEYSTDLVKDCGYIPNELPDFIENNIDWDGVAEELKVDYTTVEYEGSTYHIR